MLRVFGAAVALMAASAASAVTVVDFNGLGSEDEITSVSTQGFTFTKLGPPAAGLYVWPGDSPNSNGTDNLIAYRTDVRITRDDGAAFKLVSAKFAISWNAVDPTNQILVNGQTLDITNVLTTYTFNLSGKSVVFSSLLFDNAYWTADDFTFAEASVVPEPGTWALMIAGFGAIGFAARRRALAA